MRAGQVSPGRRLARHSRTGVQVVRCNHKTAQRRDDGRIIREGVSVGTAQQLAPDRERRATVFARAVFAAWGLMAEIIGAAVVVFGLFFAALALTGTALVMFF